MIKIRSEELEALKLYEQAHLDMVKRFQKYEDIEYISKNYEKFVTEPEKEDIFEPGKTYIVNYNKNKIGMIGTTKIDSNGIIELWYVIDKYYRKKGYGSKTLGLVTQYLLEYVQNVEDVQLLINKENEASIKCAENNGYSKASEFAGNYVYRYFN